MRWGVVLRLGGWGEGKGGLTDGGDLLLDLGDHLLEGVHVNAGGHVVVGALHLVVARHHAVGVNVLQGEGSGGGGGAHLMGLDLLGVLGLLEGGRKSAAEEANDSESLDLHGKRVVWL